MTGQSVSAGKTIHANDKIELICAIKCKLYLDISSEYNLIFSTYDITISFDGKEIGSVSNGGEFTYLADILSGEHELVFCKSGNTSPRGTKKITVSSDMTYSCELSHDSSSISMKNESTEDNIGSATLEVVDVTGMDLSEAMKTLENIGFSNLREEPYGSIWDRDNWIVTCQGLAAGTIADKNEFIQLDCISLDDYFSNNYVGKNVNEIQKLAEKGEFSLRFEDSSWTDLNSKVTAMDEATKTDWVATSARQYGGADKTAVVTIKYTGDVEEIPNTDENEKTQESTTAEKDDDVITVENNADFAELLSSEYVDPNKQAEFVRKYKGKVIEFNCIVLYMTQNEKYDTIYSYVLIPGEDTEHIGAVLFMLEDASSFDFKWDSKTRPSYLMVGSMMKMQAEIISGDDSTYIYLDPVKTWGR